MGETEDSKKHEDKGEVEKKDKKEKKEKHEADDGKEEKGVEKTKDKKKKDKDCKDKEVIEGGKEKKKKNPEDKNDPAKVRQKLEKIDSKMQALVVKKEELLKQLKEVEQGAPNASQAPITTSS